MKTRLTKQLGIQYPIIQAPMAGVSTPRLAAAVSNAGGLGSLGIGANTASQAQALIKETKALTLKPFGVNVFCHKPALRDPQKEQAWLNFLSPFFAEVSSPTPTSLTEIYQSFLVNNDLLDVLLNERPPIVSFHFGIPSRKVLDAMHNVGIQTLACATSVEEATLIEESGIQGIIAQGFEAGGHRGCFDSTSDPQNDFSKDEKLSTAELVKRLTQKTKVAVIAAGGIMDGRGIRAVLDLGAEAAQLGTAFLLCPESATPQPFRDLIKKTKDNETRMTSVLSGRPARGLINRFILHAEKPGSPSPPAYPIAYDAQKRLSAAAMKKDIHDFSAYLAGQGVNLVREMPAAEFVAALVSEMKTV